MNSFGRIFRVTIFGESHGPAAGIVIDGCPAGISLVTDDFLYDLGRRKSGARGTTPRTEDDLPALLSGVFNGKTTGAPITITVANRNTDPGAYTGIIDVPRPGHADFVASVKYGGYHDYRGGGHFSGRITVALVAAGVVAKKIIAPVTVQAHLAEAGGDANIEQGIEKALHDNDSIGGIVECRAENVPPGLGEPFFDSLEALISHMMFSIPAIKGIEFGAGFRAARMRGSEHNDPITGADGTTSSNHAGGINGGLSNGNELVFRLAVKPASSIQKPQQTFDMRRKEMVTLRLQGRHDACIALRVPPVAEAGLAVVLADLMLMEQKVKRIF